MQISPPEMFTLNEMNMNCTTIKKILKPKLYKGVIVQQSKSKKVKPQEKREELQQHIDEGSSVKAGFGIFWYFTFFIRRGTLLYISLLCLAVDLLHTISQEPYIM